MSNTWTKDEITLHDKVIEAFEDQLVMSENVKIDSTFTADPTLEADTNKVFWRPQPLIEIASDGSDITGLISETNELAVPASVGFRKNVAKSMDENDIKRGTRETSVAEASMIALASQINIDVANLVCYQGSNFVKRTVSATGFDDVAEIDKANAALKEKIGFQVSDIRGMYSYGTGKYPQDCSESTKAIVKKLYAVDYLLFEGVDHGGA